MLDLYYHIVVWIIVDILHKIQYVHNVLSALLLFFVVFTSLFFFFFHWQFKIHIFTMEMLFFCFFHILRREDFAETVVFSLPHSFKFSICSRFSFKFCCFFFVHVEMRVCILLLYFLVWNCVVFFFNLFVAFVEVVHFNWIDLVYLCFWNEEFD